MSPNRDAVRIDLLGRIAAVPHAVAIPHVDERIHVRDRDAVIFEAVVVDDGVAGAPLVDTDVMLFGCEHASERDRPARLDQRRRRCALGGCD